MRRERTSCTGDRNVDEHRLRRGVHGGWVTFQQMRRQNERLFEHRPWAFLKNNRPAEERSLQGDTTFEFRPAVAESECRHVPVQVRTRPSWKPACRREKPIPSGLLAS
jgi:hypothetical protein